MPIAKPTANLSWRRTVMTALAVASLAALCVSSAAMMASFEKALGEQIASRLLLTPNVIEIKTWHPTEPLDYRIPLSFEEIYIEFAERCDGFMGFTLAQGYPSWLII